MEGRQGCGTIAGEPRAERRERIGPIGLILTYVS
jgi:hypothetical protein